MLGYPSTPPPRRPLGLENGLPSPPPPHLNPIFSPTYGGREQWRTSFGRLRDWFGALCGTTDGHAPGTPPMVVTGRTRHEWAFDSSQAGGGQADPCRAACVC